MCVHCRLSRPNLKYDRILWHGDDDPRSTIQSVRTDEVKSKMFRRTRDSNRTNRRRDNVRDEIIGKNPSRPPSYRRFTAVGAGNVENFGRRATATGVAPGRVFSNGIGYRERGVSFPFVDAKCLDRTGMGHANWSMETTDHRIACLSVFDGRLIKIPYCLKENETNIVILYARYVYN